MHVDTVFLVWTLIFAARLWRTAHGVSPVPSVPDRVQALVGSCVVIPCSFPPPAPVRGGAERVDVRLRFRGGGPFFPLRSTAFNSEDRDQVSRDFQGRTSLFGRIQDGDCSVKVERISRDDSRVFEITLKKGDDLLWGRPKSFKLDVLDTPEAPVISGVSSATEGQLVSLNCSVSYHCPPTPPVLQWSWERGARANSTELGEARTLYPEPHRPVLLAPLSFTVSHQVKPRLRCEVRFPGANVVSVSRDLHVTFPPRDVVVRVESLMVREGASALLVCSCKADPPATEYRWSYSQQGRTVHLHQRTHTVRLFNVTRDTRVRCAARNAIGRAESRPTALNAQYEPAILRLSACVLEDLEVLCRCSVESNPEAAVTWSVNGTVPPRGYNVSVTSEPGALTATLRGRMDRPEVVVCYAFNALGNDSMVLLRGGGAEMSPLVWSVIPAVAICLVIFLLSLLFYCGRKRAVKHGLSRRPAVYPEGMGIYQDQMPLYINCTEVTHIYTNGSYQLVYQNCTPNFVHTKQIRPMGRRGGERRRGGEDRGLDGRGGSGDRGTREVQSTSGAEAETAIYLEVL